MLTQPEKLILNAEINHAKCSGETGSINIELTGGTLPYSYIWPTGDTTKNIQNLDSGWHKVIVADSNDCSLKDSIEIIEPPPLIIDFISTHTCFDDSTGTITSTVNGGESPYKYIWNNGATTPDLLNAAKGIYLLTVTDNNDCIATASDTIDEFPEVQTIQITGHTIVEPAEATVYSVPLNNEVTYFWQSQNGNIIDFPSENSVEIQWGNSGTAYIYVIPTNEYDCIGDTAILQVSIGSQGVNKKQYYKVSTYPNPFTDYMIISFNNAEKYSFDLYIIELTGKLCRIVNDINTSEYVLERKDLESGIYFLELRGPRTYRGKIIIE